MNYETATELINENIKDTNKTQCVNDILFECKYSDVEIILKVLIDKIMVLKNNTIELNKCCENPDVRWNKIELEIGDKKGTYKDFSYNFCDNCGHTSDEGFE